MKQYLKCLSLFIFLFGSTANAGILIEPYLGYLLGDGEKEISFNNNSGALKMDSDYSGAIIGGRLGYSTFGFMVGLDYSFSSYELSSKAETSTSSWGGTSIATEKYEVDDNQLGLFVGYELPILFRVWGTYFLSASRELTKDSTGTGIFKKGDKMDGSGFALGVGHTFLPFFNVNFEYRMIDYDQNTGGEDTSSSSGRKHDSKDTQMILSISAPFNF